MEYLGSLFSAEGFMPHGHCYLWTPLLLWTYVIADVSTGLAFYSIPLALTYFVRKRTDLKFNWIFKLFSMFILYCGTTHLLSVWTIWNPDYWLDAAVRVILFRAEGDSAASYDYKSPGFFSDEKLTTKVSTLGDAGGVSDAKHEKVPAKLGATYYVGDETGSVYAIEIAERKNADIGVNVRRVEAIQ